MLNRISSAELTEWMAFYEIEPFGDRVNSLGHAMTAAQITNMFYKKEDKRPFEADDFMLQFGYSVEKLPQTPEEQMATAKAITILSGGEIING